MSLRFAWQSTKTASKGWVEYKSYIVELSGTSRDQNMQTASESLSLVQLLVRSDSFEHHDIVTISMGAKEVSSYSNSQSHRIVQEISLAVKKLLAKQNGSDVAFDFAVVKRLLHLCTGISEDMSGNHCSVYNNHVQHGMHLIMLVPLRSQSNSWNLPLMLLNLVVGKGIEVGGRHPFPHLQQAPSSEVTVLATGVANSTPWVARLGHMVKMRKESTLISMFPWYFRVHLKYISCLFLPPPDIAKPLLRSKPLVLWTLRSNDQVYGPFCSTRGRISYIYIYVICI